MGGHICQGACAEIEDNSLELDRSYSVGLGAPTCRSWGSYSAGLGGPTVWVLGIKLRLSGSVSAFFTSLSISPNPGSGV